MKPSPATAPQPLLALDTASLYFRAFYAIPRSLTATDGTPANALRGLLQMITWLVQQRRPGRIIAAMDADWRPQFRVDALPSYKTHRVDTERLTAVGKIEADEAVEADRAAGASSLHASATGAESVPEGLGEQVEAIAALLPALGIACYGVPGYEADDVLGSIATRFASAATPVEIVTGDRDLFQLVDDQRGVRVLSVTKGVAQYEVMDDAHVLAKYGITPSQYVDFAVLRGDSSDGLPGVAGIGEKTAARLLAGYGSTSALLEAALACAGGERATNASSDSGSSANGTSDNASSDSGRAVNGKTGAPGNLGKKSTAAQPETAKPALTPRLIQSLLQARDYIPAATLVSTVVTKLQVPALPAPLPHGSTDPELVNELAAHWKVERLVQALQAELAREPGAAPASS